MVTAADIGWGKYDKYEGPYYHGQLKYVTPIQSDFLDKALATITATEGGCYDAINMYDRCILSVGLIQWCEAGQFSVSAILGRCADLDSFMFQSRLKSFPRPVTFVKTSAGVYRFRLDNGMMVDNQAAQQLLYFGGAPGLLGKWNDTTKAYAKEVAAWFANFWDYPLFRTVQAGFTKNKLTGFLTTDAQRLLFQGATGNDFFSWGGAMRAAYYSFAANLPAVASKSLIKASQDPEWSTADLQAKCILLLKTMTFGPGIAIYPGRYDKIAKILTNLFGVAVPPTADALKDWKEPADMPDSLQVSTTEAEQAAAGGAPKLHDQEVCEEAPNTEPSSTG